MQSIAYIAATLIAVYVMARLIIMAYFAERAVHIKQILKMSKEFQNR
jgi:hypothetical protein